MQSCDELKFIATYEEVEMVIPFSSQHDMGKSSLRCNYHLEMSPTYKFFIEQVKDRKLITKGYPTAFCKLYMIVSTSNQKYDGINLIMLYKRNMITQ